MKNIRSTIFLASAVLTVASLPAAAMPMPTITKSEALSTPIIPVRDHGHRHGYRRDHRFHGRDDYYDRDDQSGTLFKSFVMGTLFR